MPKRLGVLGLMLLGAMVALAAPAHAVRLVKVDEQIVKELPPQPAIVGDPCSFDFAFSLAADTDGRTAFTRLAASDSVLGTAADCNLSASITLTASITFALAPEPGEALGLPVTICAQGLHDLAAESIAPYQARADFGGLALSDPATVVRSPGMVTELSEGPVNLVDNGNGNGSAIEQFSASIGDLITMKVGVRAATAGMGVGSASARSRGELYVNIGSCASQGAPAASPIGLLALAVGLGGLGMLTIAWRRRRGAA